MTDIVSGEVEDREPTPEEQGKDAAASEMGKKGGKARADLTLLQPVDQRHGGGGCPELSLMNEIDEHVAWTWLRR